MPSSLLRPSSRTRRLRAAVWCLLALAFDLLGAGGMARAALAGNIEFVPALCTSHGVATPETSLPAGDPASTHDCCTACGIGGAPLALSPENAVLPAPTFSLSVRSTAAPVLGAPRAGALPPRGPPVAA